MKEIVEENKEYNSKKCFFCKINLTFKDLQFNNSDVKTWKYMLENSSAHADCYIEHVVFKCLKSYDLGQ